MGSVAGIWTEHAGVLEQRGERRLMKLDAEKCTPYLLDGTSGRLFASSSGLGGRGSGLSDGRGSARADGASEAAGVAGAGARSRVGVP